MIPSMSAEKFPVTTPRHPHALFFDGECRFCNRWVGRLLRADLGRRTRFGAKQGVTFQRLAAGRPEAANVQSIILVQRDDQGREHILTRSSAVREAIRGLPRYAFASALLSLTPRPLADLGYGIFSRFRKRLFGTQDLCHVIKPADRELFLD
jgi:predicted DCC family thiol-disulfide oxidoreductase YuxK